jgi:hypothetical protein
MLMGKPFHLTHHSYDAMMDFEREDFDFEDVATAVPMLPPSHADDSDEDIEHVIQSLERQFLAKNISNGPRKRQESSYGKVPPILKSGGKQQWVASGVKEWQALVCVAAGLEVSEMPTMKKGTPGDLEDDNCHAATTGGWTLGLSHGEQFVEIFKNEYYPAEDHATVRDQLRQLVMGKLTRIEDFVAEHRGLMTRINYLTTWQNSNTDLYKFQSSIA